MIETHVSSRRLFLAQASCFGAAAALARFFPSPVMAEAVAQDPRVAATPLLDRGFAATRKIGDGIYATIADPSKGFDALCNGGFLVGRDAALLIEGHASVKGSAMELEALRMITQAPVRAALDTHYHFDHSCGNSFYGGQGIPIMAHAKCAPMIVERYASLQAGGDRALLAAYEGPLAKAKNETEKQRAQGDLQATQGLVSTVLHSTLALPNQPLDPAKLPMSIDLGGVKAVIETYPGHTPTDIIVRVPEQNIIFTGDLLFNGSYPVTFDGNMTGWMKTLDGFLKWPKDTLLVPGHGAVCGLEAVAQERAIIEDLGSHAQKMLKAGVTDWREASQRYVIPPQFSKLGYFSWGFCIGGAIAHFMDELRAGAK
jgi:glyoxylase-like metal-dependent hydrolase (beta-lactamase superfamily II)